MTFQEVAWDYENGWFLCTSTLWSVIFTWFCILACESSNPHWIGDGVCDDETNNAGCGFDGGDCCGPNVKTAYCLDCQCLGENITSKAAPGPFCSCSVEGILGCKLLVYFDIMN